MSFSNLISRVQGSINLEAGDWQISGRVKNTEGWSEDGFAEIAHLKLPKGKFLIIF